MSSHAFCKSRTHPKLKVYHRGDTEAAEILPFLTKFTPPQKQARALSVQLQFSLGGALNR